VTVRLSNGDALPAKLVGADAQTDLAVLKIDSQGLSPVTLADSEDVTVGQPVVAIGNPLGTLGGTVTEGIISAKDREIVIDGDTMVLLQTSAAINPGNSGGGIFNKESQLVGVVNAKSSGSDIEGLGFAIPSNTVNMIITELIENGYVTGRPALGVEIVEINSLEALYQYKVNDYGVYVTSTNTDGSLQKGDRFLQINGQEVSRYSEIKKIVDENSIGDSLEITIKRGSKTKIVIVVLEEKKSVLSDNIQL